MAADTRGGHAGWIMIAAILGGALVFAATYLGSATTMLGAALMGGLAAVAAALFAGAVTASRGRGLLVLLAIIMVPLGGWVFVAMQRQTPDGVAELVGGCPVFTVYAQNRWIPVGASKRAKPQPSGNKVGSYAPNELVSVDGWVRTNSPYPSNPSPWDSDVWFHISDGSGWVSFAGLRASPTPFDPSGQSPNGGEPVPLATECSGTVRWPSE